MTTDSENQPLQTREAGGLLDLELLSDTVDVSILSSSGALVFEVPENATRQVSVDGEGAALLDLSVFSDADLDLLVYRAEEGSSQATLVYAVEDYLEASGGILGANWEADVLALPEFQGGGTYYVTLGNEGGLLDVTLLSSLSLSTTSDVITTSSVSGDVDGNVITDAGPEGTDRVPPGTIVTSVDGTPIASGGTDIDGEYGVLTIRPDGSYTYVLDTDAGENAGGQETFAYTLEAPNGDTETATLTLTFDSPAASELAMAGLSDPVHDDFESMLQHFGSNADTKFDIGTSGSAAVLQFTEDSPVEYSDAVRIEVNNAYPM